MNILLTRPLSQSKPLKHLILDGGDQPILFPTLEIKALDATPLHDHYDAIIFISANAVDYGVKVLEGLNLEHCQVFAVGEATASKVMSCGFQVDAYPRSNASSEALLALTEVRQLKNKSILIFRGVGGRETLKESLVKQFNTVEYAEVYERVECTTTQLHRNSLVQLSNNHDSMIVITSIESLVAMMNLVNNIEVNLLNKLQKTPLIVLSERIRNFAKSVDFLRVFVAIEPNDHGVVAKIHQLKLAKYNTLDK